MPRSGLTRKYFAVVLLVLLFVVPPTPSLSQPIDISAIAETSQIEFLSISSDQEAAELFLKHFGQNLTLTSEPRGTSNHPPRLVISKEATSEMFQFMVNLVISLRAKRTQSFLQPLDVPRLDSLLNKDTAQFRWILSTLTPDTLTPMVDLTTTYLELFKTTQTVNNQPPLNFHVFAEYFDQTHPQLLGSPTSWVGLFESGGVPAIHDRLHDFWERPPSQPRKHDPEWSDPYKNKESYAQFYLKTRFLPVLSAHLLARLIRAQAISEQTARLSFMRLQEKTDSDPYAPGFNRLCGTWHWTVHNHQNHSDHKMKLSFLPPSQEPGRHPQPDEIIIHGDTVYLKWEFQSGFQEDSLLLSNRDQRLEGTFRNSLGARGTITGKRLSTCPP